MALKYDSHELQLGRLMLKTARKYIGVLGRNLSHIDIERYFSIIVLLEQSDKPMTQKELAGFLGVDKVTIVRMIDYLTDKNMLERKVNSHDRRERLLELTKKAKKLTPDIRDAIMRVNESAMKGLNEEKKKDFFKTLALMNANLNGLPAEEYTIRIRKNRRK